MDSSFNNGYSHRGRGRGTPDIRRDLRRPHDNAAVSQQPVGGGDMPSMSGAVRPSSSTTMNYASVVAGSVSGGDHTNRNQNATFNTTEEVNSSRLSSNSYSQPRPEPSLQQLQQEEEAAMGNNSNLNPLANVFVPRTYRIPPTDELAHDLNSESQAEYIVMYLNDFIYEVTLNPGKFDRSIGLFVQNLNKMINDEASLLAIVDTIFEQATRESNFRYNAARLCNNLCTSSCHFQDLSFRSVLLDQCASRYVNREIEAEQDIAKLRGFIFFVAELYSQIKVNDHSVGSLSEALPLLFETLLNYPTSDNFKCVCQMMKFTGPSLEDEEKARLKGTPCMDKLISFLESSVPTAPRDVQNMISSVVKLRECNWGRTVTPPNMKTEPILTADIPTEAVFYGPDGVPLTNEEALFLEREYAQYEGDDYGDDEDEDGDSEGMDDEIAAAFEDFLLQSGQKPT